MDPETERLSRSQGLRFRRLFYRMKDIPSRIPGFQSFRATSHKLIQTRCIIY